MPSLLITIVLSLPAGGTNDTDFDKQWALHNSGQTVNGMPGIAGSDINALSAWTRHGGTRPVVVAVIGTGVNPHDEFASRMLPGYVSTLAGGDPYSTLDTGQQGTRAAGVIAARRENGDGIAGLNDRAWILPIRVANGPQVSAESIAEGLIWAADRRPDVAIILVQLYSPSQALADALAFAKAHDVVVVAPAGHDASNGVAYPAAYDDCIAVSATNCRDELSFFSNYGPEVDLAAPGEGIWSTTAAGGYDYEENGVSFMAAAHVAGAASLLRSFAPGLSAAAIRTLLVNTADDLGDPGLDAHFGAGRLNTHAALLSAPTPLLRIEPAAPIPTRLQPNQAISFPVRIANGTGSLNPTSPELVYRTSPGPFTGSNRMQSLGGNLFQATVPAVDCGTTLEFYLLAGSLSGLTVSDPPQVPNVLHKGIPNPDLVLFLDDFEDDIGWVVSSMGSGTKGVWTRDEPNGTEFQNLLLQPEYDRSENEGENCYFTGQDDPEDLIGTNDVDLGPVTLTSPIIDMAQHQNVEVRFASWLRSPTGTPDHLLVEISRNAGVQWFNATAIAPTDGWEQIELPLSAFPGLVGSQLRVRFTISDNPSDSLTEAAIDDFEVVSVACDGVLGDANGDGIVNLRDMGILGGCLTGPLTQRLTHCASVDLNNDLRVDLQDISLFERYFRP